MYILWHALSSNHALLKYTYYCYKLLQSPSLSLYIICLLNCMCLLIFIFTLHGKQYAVQIAEGDNQHEQVQVVVIYNPLPRAAGKIQYEAEAE